MPVSLLPLLRLKPFATAAVMAASFAVVSLAGAGNPQRPAAVPSGTAPSTGPCRTYDTSVTSVTAGGPMRSTVEWTGVFDPSSLRFVQNINVSSNQGAHFSYVQVSSWASVEDFIAEVVRLKAPATLASNPNGRVLDIVPPLTRSVSTIGNGTIALTKTNTFDSTNRLTGFTTRSGGGTNTVRYTAWDTIGRPTAGTMQAPNATSTVALSYDDTALTQTERTTTRGITSVMTSTYDQFGNLRGSTASVTGGQPSSTTVTPHANAKVCLGDVKKPDTPPLKAAGPNPAGTFSGSIGGQSWTASVGVHAENGGANVSVGGSDGRYIVAIALSTGNGPGEYRAGALADEDYTKLTKEQFTQLLQRNSVVATVFDSRTKQSWQASPTIGNGTVTMTGLGGAAAGTFALTLDAVPGTGASGPLRFTGTFNIRY
jgi:hypothetical protein